MSGTPDDPVVARRAQVARWSGLAKRAGYGAILLAFVAFAIGLATSFSGVVTGVITVSLAASAALLIPAVIFSYGVKAAEQEERGEPFRY